jgi:hypothetical protein
MSETLYSRAIYQLEALVADLLRDASKREGDPTRFTVDELNCIRQMAIDAQNPLRSAFQKWLNANKK